MIFIHTAQMANPAAKVRTRTLVTGRRNRRFAFDPNRQRGVTLVELLVVLVILAMVAGVVILTTPPPVSDLRNNAERFAAKLNHAAGTAITAGIPIALEIDATGYRFRQYENGAWMAVSEPGLHDIELDSETSLQILSENTANREAQSDLSEPEIRTLIFSPTGETMPMSVGIRRGRDIIYVTMDDFGKVEVNANAPE
ncbi:GspH/FimT family pseudopilin [Hyphococcus formosus]|uniref:GspH/FimT family pseudopilin n=1 Tax=Hyphococcus formosus TaxID=3143534 RepID=UPI00398B297D